MKAKLSELETKPSDSLWAKMEKELDTDSFEPSLRQKFEDFAVPVSDKTWNTIEAQLPHEKNKKRILAFWFSGIFISALSLGILISRFYFPAVSESNELSLQSTSKEVNQVQIESKQETQLSIAAKSITPIEASGDKNLNKPSEIIKDANLNIQDEPVLVSSSANRNQFNLIAESNSSKKTKSSYPLASSQKANDKTFSDNGSLLVQSSPKNQSGSNPENPVSNQSNNSNNPITSQVPTKQEPPLVNAQEGTTKANESEGRQLSEAKAPIQLEDVQIKFDKDSIVRGQEVNAENYTSEEDKLGKFSITAVVGVFRTEMLLSKPSTSVYDLNKAFDLRSKLERPSIDWSGGFLLNYNIHPKWMISSGVQISNFKQALHYDLADPVSDTFNQLQSPNLYLHPSDSIIEGHVKTLVNKFSFTEIPIWITYSIHTDRTIGFDLMVGYSFAFLTSVNAYMPDPACVGLLNVNDKNSFPFLKGSSFVNFAPAVNYKINQSVQLGLMPQFKLGLSSVIDNKNWIQEKPMAVGLNFYLRKRF